LGASAATLRTSALALCYSTAEYCAPVWSRSLHTKLIDIQLNETMRIISGTLQSTSIPWLPVLSHIPLPYRRREDAISKLFNKVEFSDHLPLFSDICHHPTLRLPSRHPVWKGNPSADATASVSSRCRDDWQSATVINSSLVDDPTVRLPGFHLSRRQWSLLNRFRTGQGHCGMCRKKWGLTNNEMCACGDIQTCHISLIPAC